jgi:hypothetical protein
MISSASLSLNPVSIEFRTKVFSQPLMSDVAGRGVGRG